jgi:hypothetical protein
MRFYLPFFVLLLGLASCNPCKNSNCQNSGTCVEGACKCVTPYGGKNCEINLCDSTVCNNGGYCVSGVCDCATGYEGVHCDNLVTTKFVGSFSCVQACPAITSYSVTITATALPSASNIVFNSLNGLQPVALVSGYVINIQSQVLPGGQTVSGSGQMSADGTTITFTMSIIPRGATTGNSCTYTLTRM